MLDLQEAIALMEQHRPAAAIRFARQIVQFCEGLSCFPERGTAWAGLGPGIRTIPFRKGVTIAIEIEGSAVSIGAIFYRGRDIGTALRDRFGDNAKETKP